MMSGQATPPGDSDHETASYARQVGSCLRQVRREKRLSLQDVESRSGQEFKASVLGAYERGERAISVPRLKRLSELYLVPVDDLLPPVPGSARRGNGQEASPGRPWDGRLTFDLAAFDGVEDAQMRMVRRFVANVRTMRQDFTGHQLTVRHDDVRTIAGLFGVEPAALFAWLDRYRVATTR